MAHASETKSVTRCLLAVLAIAGVCLAGEPAADTKTAPTADTKTAPTADTKAAPAADTKPAVPQEDKVGDNEEAIMIGGMVTQGFVVLPATETEFRFKLSATKTIIALRWSDLPEEERRRVQKLYGVKIEDGRRVFGDPIKGVKIMLGSGKSFEGLPLPERSRPGKIAIRTAASPFMEIPESDIKSKEEVEYPESYFFSAQEIYQKWMLAKQISDKDAPGHLAMAKRCAGIGLFGKAIDHVKMATEIDKQMEERNKDFIAQLAEQDAKQRVEALYTEMITAKNANRFYEASYKLDQLERNFPNSDYKSRWEGVKPAIESGLKVDLAKNVIQLSYAVASDLVQQKLFRKVPVDEKNNVVPSIPGKQVTTRHSHVFRGTLVSGEAGGDMVLKCGETNVTIAAKEIMMVQDVDLSVAASYVAPTFEDLKDYVSDPNRPDGLKGEMIAKISLKLKQPEAKVKEIFDGRLATDAVYNDQGQYIKTPTYFVVHDIAYGRGSWVREGSKPMPLPPAQTKQNQPNVQRLRNNQGQGQPQPKPPDPQENPELTDDPSIWWKFQNPETQLSVLRSMAAEKVFSAKVKDDQCMNCRGTGLISVMGEGGNLEAHRCPICRGMGKLFKLMYR